MTFEKKSKENGLGVAGDLEDTHLLFGIYVLLLILDDGRKEFR